jgi:hypothetical protein
MEQLLYTENKVLVTLHVSTSRRGLVVVAYSSQVVIAGTLDPFSFAGAHYPP